MTGRLGAYYAAHLLDPISGLGVVSSQASLAHEAIRPMLRGPSGNYRAWGVQEPTGFRPSDVDVVYRTFPVNASTLAAAEREAMGNPVGLVAAVYPSALTLGQAAALFAEGPYEFSHAEVVYRVEDTSGTPRPWFLYWGALADEGTRDASTSYDALESAIAISGGEFVFVLPAEPPEGLGPRPRMDVSSASTAPMQAPGAPSSPTSTPAIAPAPPAPQAEPGPAQSSTRPSLVVLGIVGALGVAAGWGIVRGW